MIIEADARHIPLADESVNCVVTSPPYWGLRDYSACSCVQHRVKDASSTLVGSAEGKPNHRSAPDPDCQKCNGTGKIDIPQIGLESTPEEYVEVMLSVFREVWRVMRPDGTLWLNLGDSYWNGGGEKRDGGHGFVDGGKKKLELAKGALLQRKSSTALKLKPKDLVGIPWRVAFALQADGWYLRSDIIWAKPNPMPESVTDRPTKAHEYLFLLSKSPRYYYDADAVREIHQDSRVVNGEYQSSGVNREDWTAPVKDGLAREGFRMVDRNYNPLARNRRTVWTIATQPYSEAHFATFPEKLVEPCILAGSRAAGKRCDCDDVILTPTGNGAISDPSLMTGRAGMNRPRRNNEGSRPITRREQRGHADQLKSSPHRPEIEAMCGLAFEHYIRTDIAGARPLPPRILGELVVRGWIVDVPPCTHPEEPADIVFDPFVGSGTTVRVAESLNRRGIGLDLTYHSISSKRVSNVQRNLMGFTDEL